MVLVSKKRVKRYALDLVDEMRNDVKDTLNRKRPPIDLAEVISTSPEIVIESFSYSSRYDEDTLVFNIDPDSLSVGDTIVLGMTPLGIPVIIGVADANNEDPLNDPALMTLYEDSFLLRENTSHWKASVDSYSVLPSAGNDNGDLRYSLSDNIIYRWDSDAQVWAAVASSSITSTVTIQAVNSPYYITNFNSVILADSTSGDITINLPSAHSNGESYTIKDSGGNSSENNIVITSLAGDLVDGAIDFALTNDYESAQFISDGSNWFII